MFEGIVMIEFQLIGNGMGISWIGTTIMFHLKVASMCVRVLHLSLPPLWAIGS